jgi:hypothetical protein
MSIERLLSPVFLVMAACAIPAAALSAETPPKSAEANTAPADPARAPFIVRNPDGTLTVQKQPAPGKTENAGENGLVIPPQVIVPIASAPATTKENQGR